jgi:3-oxoacyl-[acyl-carrier protein] reductase
MDLNLNGKTALVTGGSKGIGRAVAECLAGEGCNLHLAARNEADLAAARDAIAGRYNVAVDIHPADLSLADARAALADEIGDIDVLINNAGAIPGGGIDDVDDATWRESWELKVFGYVHFTRIYYERMRKQGHGAIVNVTGMGGKLSMPSYIAGTAGNAALIQFSVSLGEESIKNGVRVLCVNPGPTETERMTYLAKLRAETELGDPERWQELSSRSRFGRAAKPEEVANVIVFMASDRASYMSGVQIDMG